MKKSSLKRNALSQKKSRSPRETISVIKKLIPTSVVNVARKHPLLTKSKSVERTRASTKKSVRKSSETRKVKKPASNKKAVIHGDFVVKRKILNVISSRLFHSIMSASIGTTAASLIVTDPILKNKIYSFACATALEGPLHYLVSAETVETVYYWMAIAAISSAVQSVYALILGGKYSRYKKFQM